MPITSPSQTHNISVVHHEVYRARQIDQKTQNVFLFLSFFFFLQKSDVIFAII